MRRGRNHVWQSGDKAEQNSSPLPLLKFFHCLNLQVQSVLAAPAVPNHGWLCSFAFCWMGRGRPFHVEPIPPPPFPRDGLTGV